MKSAKEMLVPDHASVMHGPIPHDWRPLRAALFVAIAYYIGAKVGFALTFQPHPISVLWPPNAVLLSALLLAPVRWWPWLIAGAFPAHLVAELQSGVPTAMVLCWFVSNASEALIGAVLVRRFMGYPPTLDTTRNVVVFFCGAVLAAPFFSSFLDAAFVSLVQWGKSDYWQVWRTRVISNALATLTIVPLVVTWAFRPKEGTLVPAGQRLEGIVLLGALIAVCVAVFDFEGGELQFPSALLYLPLPFLLWATLRFGPRGASMAFAIFAFLAIWGAGEGHGPFAVDVVSVSALSVQVFLISAAIPLLFLAAISQERESAERNLRKSEERFATAFRASPDAVIITRLRDGKIIDVNDRWISVFGYVRAHIVGQTLKQMNVYESELDRVRVESMLEERGTVREEAIDVRTCQGALLHTLWSCERVDIDGETCMITTMRDVTRQRTSELELREQRKQLTHLTRVARLSELSGSLAHELNQPLTAILSNAQAAQRFLTHEPLDLPEIRSILHDIVEADKRAGEVIRGLRLLMKKGDDQFAPVSLNDVVRQVLVLAHSELISCGVAVETRLAPDLPRVHGSVVQLQQLLLNLVSNACEAMHTGDRQARELTVTTAVGAHGTAQLLVADTGMGLSRDQRLFEPFYTTKEHGLGLGLSICRTIMEAHGGSIHAENNPHRGATFRVVFPAQVPAIA